MTLLQNPDFYEILKDIITGIILIIQVISQKPFYDNRLPRISGISKYNIFKRSTWRLYLLIFGSFAFVILYLLQQKFKVVQKEKPLIVKEKIVPLIIKDTVNEKSPKKGPVILTSHYMPTVIENRYDEKRKMYHFFTSFPIWNSGESAAILKTTEITYTGIDTSTRGIRSVYKEFFDIDPNTGLGLTDATWTSKEPDTLYAILKVKYTDYINTKYPIKSFYYRTYKLGGNWVWFGLGQYAIDRIENKLKNYPPINESPPDNTSVLHSIKKTN